MSDDSITNGCDEDDDPEDGSHRRHQMDFRLRSPCYSCPFRTDKLFHLRPERVRQIERDLTRNNATFACHMTVDYDHTKPATYRESHCAGALIILQKTLRVQPQLMQIAERLGLYDPKLLEMDAPVYDTFDELVAALEAFERSGRSRA